MKHEEDTVKTFWRLLKGAGIALLVSVIGRAFMGMVMFQLWKDESNLTEFPFPGIAWYDLLVIPPAITVAVMLVLSNQRFCRAVLSEISETAACFGLIVGLAIGYLTGDAVRSGSDVLPSVLVVLLFPMSIAVALGLRGREPNSLPAQWLLNLALFYLVCGASYLAASATWWGSANALASRAYLPLAWGLIVYGPLLMLRVIWLRFRRGNTAPPLPPPENRGSENHPLVAPY